ncbi:MAG: hypothetical protein HY805_00150 [Nitrospirae bacterium]|nr:hypothetical protein [Nitrospirota bacterium]
MYDLYERFKAEVSTTSVHAIKLLDILFYSPIVSFPTIRKRLADVSNQTIYNLLTRFEKKGIITEISGRKRGKLFALKSLLDILKETE